MNDRHPVVSDDALTGYIDAPETRNDVSAQALTDAFLRRIAECQPQTNAFITVTPNLARDQAAKIDLARSQGRRLLPLDGLIVAIKDDIDVAGIRCTSGSEFFADHVSETDAPIVRRLKEAGAIIVGKTGLHEFAYGITCNNPHYGVIRNPWDLTRIPGGSSGGSGAALASDCCVAALGSDGGGSVRVPAALNGVTGLRPTLGTISGEGVFPIVRSFETVGPMARSAEDVRAVFDVIRNCVGSPAVRPDQPVASDGLVGLRIGIPTNYFFDDTAAEVTAATHAAADVLVELGASLEEIHVAGAEEVLEIATIVSRAEALAIHWERFQKSPERFGEDVRERLGLGLSITGVELALQLDRMKVLRSQLLATFDRVDVVVTPTTEDVPPLISESAMIPTTARFTRLTWPWSLAGNPALSMPAGTSSEGLPIGVQLAAAPYRDDLLLRIGQAFQARTSWHRSRPDTRRAAP